MRSKYEAPEYWAPEFLPYNSFGVPEECFEAIEYAFDKILYVDPEAKILQVKTKFTDIRFYVRPGSDNPLVQSIVYDLASKGEAAALWSIQRKKINEEREARENESNEEN